MSRRLAYLLASLLSACAGYSGSGLIAGESGENEVIRVMGKPQMEWVEPDGARRLAYPRGPMGVHTFMVLIGADGKLQRIENVLEPRSFRRIRPGMRKDQVLHLLGPAEPSWTAYFKTRDELVWEWRYCNEWNQLARFDVLFDGAREVVRSTMTQLEQCGPEDDCACGR
ncbi:MAG: hypothetical protein HY066_14370 [Betaproteobacteria bacterium]|nr:hypothetical protein [Betaproteobacteria bacterium]